MKEWAQIDEAGNVMNIIISSDQPIRPGYTIRRAEDVPLYDLKKYQYWYQRP